MEQLCISLMPWCAIYVVIIVQPAFKHHLDISSATKSFVLLQNVIKSSQDLYSLIITYSYNLQFANACYNAQQLVISKSLSSVLLTINQFLNFFGFKQFNVSKNVILSPEYCISIQQINNLSFQQNINLFSCNAPP
jgi:hypothetical protein